MPPELRGNTCYGGMQDPQGSEVSVKELDSLLSLVAEKKRKLEQEEAERNMQILLDFLYCLRKKKADELNEVENDLLYIRKDLNAVERHRMALYRTRERCSVSNDPVGMRSHTSSMDRNISGLVCNSCNAKDGITSVNFQYKKDEGKVQVKPLGTQSRDASFSGPTSQHISQSGLAVIRKKRVHAQFNELQEFYLQKRRQLDNHLESQEKKDKTIIRREGYSSGLEDFQSVLSTFTRYSIEFDRDDELFATAGVSRRIKVFDFSSVVNEPTDVHCPVVEMATRSKLSCLSWNKFTKNHIASSDYEGIVTVWDVTTRQSVMEYEEHEKRAWSVDFSRTEPSMIVSGSDDCKVKVWCTKQEASVLNIDMKANICCVKYNPESSNFVAIGSADHHIHYYDLRKTCHPLHVFSGHKKAVSYVKFLSNNELASASTDSTLRLWDVKENLPTNIGLGESQAISKPATWHKFGSPDVDDTQEDAGSYFISAVCWKSESPTMLAANSKGTIKVLVLAP
ncbi:hypothetical protein DH2020_025065 [Rehmannia glutinosa]|uniref:Uncharacterized protein n=1 Tax=Rehmannia glutinosa TaxID=99300 RepID=A0ABR0W0Q7_REHGL